MIDKMILFSAFFSFIIILFIESDFVEAVQDNKLQNEGNLENTIEISCNCIAFRLDDIQDYWLDDIQIELIRIFYEREIPLTLGVLGKNFGNDEKLILEINNMVLQNSLFEIANHGWEHEDFTKLSADDQKKLLKKTNEKLQSFFGISPEIFIPPFNNFDDETIQSMKAVNMTYLSSSIVKGDKPPFPLKNSNFYRFPETATLGEYSFDLDRFVGVKKEKVIEDIEKSIDNYGFAVITMHPQEFSMIKDGKNVNELNIDQITELKELLDEIQEYNIKFVTLDKINQNSKENSIPQWIKNNAEWWAAGKIDDQTFIQSLQYLVKQGILIIPQN
ncbi:hypothetical protein C6990_10325 [Nitrosopumilus sp. b3]|uniref:polysaccharide deacetylase family protein n=1 Tax=Nitrosopumilus sp. b3 TaxID=2109909 RepID=UPI0015F67A70|nr:polysaccharide deacetylase family protein [Nitrosopumilus sp. b3]KAF6246169.1 hypothetical protein C6990_10325 [Nitrosopumilus sp. b3]